MYYNINIILTRRELDVLECLTEGKSAREIAESLHIDYETVRTHKKHIMEKLGLHSTAAIIRYVFEKKLAESGKNHPNG
jgi:DNA-binding NarL/FixJ family response regulator